MQDITIIRTAPGGHPGWLRQMFAHKGQYYDLLTIDRPEDPHSHITEVSADGNAIARKILTFPMVLSVPTAWKILNEIQLVQEDSFDKGRHDAQYKIRKALGL